MTVYSIWESRFPAASADDGRAITEAIWRDMTEYDGYLDHELLMDADEPGHLLVVSRWESREHADEVLRQYADNPNARAANSLVIEPRRRIVAVSATAP
jgi:heme-degrading monooxygenase HmoA